MAGKHLIAMTNQRLKKMQLAETLQRKGLSILAVQTVVENIFSYSLKNEEVQSLVKLPRTQYVDILQLFLKRECIDKDGNVDQLAKMLRVYQLLISKGSLYLNHLDLSGLLTFCPQFEQRSKHIAEVLELTLRHAPHIKQLIMTSKHTLYASEPIDDQLVELFAQFEQLSYLEASDFSFGFGQLCRLARILPELRVLKIGFLRTPVKDEPIRSAGQFLGRLQLLESDMERDTMRFLIRQLPQLNIFERSYHNQCWRDYSPQKTLEEHTKQKRTYLGICHEFDANVVYENTEVTHLMVDCLEAELHEQNWPLLLAFPNVLTLTMINYDNFVLDAFLNVYGHTLQTLNLCNQEADEVIGLDWIFQLCPKLRVLNMEGMHLKNYSDDSGRHPKYLEEFSYIGETAGSRIALSNILSSAPNLKRVNVGALRFHLEDLKRISALIVDKEILSELEAFHIQVHVNQESTIEDLSTLSAVSDVVKIASAHLPKLREANVFIHDGTNCLDLLTVANEMQAVSSESDNYNDGLSFLLNRSVLDDSLAQILNAFQNFNHLNPL